MLYPVVNNDESVPEDVVLQKNATPYTLRLYSNRHVALCSNNAGGCVGGLVLYLCNAPGDTFMCLKSSLDSQTAPWVIIVTERIER